MARATRSASRVVEGVGTACHIAALMATGALVVASRRGRTTNGTSLAARGSACIGRPSGPRSAVTYGCRPRLTNAGGRPDVGTSREAYVVSVPHATAMVGTGTQGTGVATATVGPRTDEGTGAPYASLNAVSPRICVAPVNDGARIAVATSRPAGLPFGRASFTPTAIDFTGAVHVVVNGRT